MQADGSCAWQEVEWAASGCLWRNVAGRLHAYGCGDAKPFLKRLQPSPLLGPTSEFCGNRLVVRISYQVIGLYSPPGATLPYVLIRSEKPKQSLPETVAATVQALFDEIYKEERLSHVRRELTKAGKPSRLRANGPYVFRCEILELPKTRNRDAKMVPKFSCPI